MMRGPVTPDMIKAMLADEEALALLSVEPGWKIMEARMETMLTEAHAVMDESNEPNDTFRLHKAVAIRKILVTLLQMVREAPKRYTALVSGTAESVTDPAPDAPV